MAPLQMKTFLEQAQTFHKKLRAFYEEHSKEAQREDVKVFLDYMSHHEEVVGKLLKEYEEDAKKEVLESWFRWSPAVGKCPNLDMVTFRPDMTHDEAVEMSMKLDECLLTMYKELQSESMSQELLDAVKSLFDMEQSEDIKAMRSNLVE